MTAFPFSSLKNNASTTINQVMTTDSPANGGMLAVTDGTVFPVEGYALVGQELVHYDSVSGNNLTLNGTDGRASGGTVAGPHNLGVAIYADFVAAAHINELIAKFGATAGHVHSGEEDDAPPIDVITLGYVSETLAVDTYFGAGAGASKADLNVELPVPRPGLWLVVAHVLIQPFFSDKTFSLIMRPMLGGAAFAWSSLKSMSSTEWLYFTLMGIVSIGAHTYVEVVATSVQDTKGYAYMSKMSNILAVQIDN